MGIIAVLVGAVLVLLSFTTLDWYGGGHGVDSASSFGFTDLHHNATALGLSGFPIAYFSWLAWVLLIGVIVVGTYASLSSRHGDAIRASGLAIGLVGLASTYYTLHQISQSGSVFTNADAGIWCAFVGYSLAGLGAAIGPWRPVMAIPGFGKKPDPATSGTAVPGEDDDNSTGTPPTGGSVDDGPPEDVPREAKRRPSPGLTRSES